MYALEFRAKVKNGTIEIPSQYRDKLKKVVRVIVLAEMEESTNNLIDQLLETPFRIKGFEPLSRNEICLQGDMNHAQYSMGYRS